jgi:hypothetical protein
VKQMWVVGNVDFSTTPCTWIPEPNRVVNVQ